MPFRDIRGHQRLVELLSRSIQHDSLPQSLLFSGPAGVGKRLTAIAVAQALNCRETQSLEPRTPNAERRTANAEPRTPNAERRTPNVEPSNGVDACGKCSVCTRIARGVHPDVLIVEPGDTGAIKIEQIREIVDRTAYRPFEGRRRVVIVDEADAIIAGAQNALLKTLEEPPPSSMFILVTSLPDMLLPTVRSRLIRLSFAEGGKLEIDVDARAVAHRVLTLAAASTDAGRRIEVAKDLLTNTGAGGSGDRDQLAAHLRAMASVLRDVEVLATGADPGILVHGDVKPALERLTATYQGERGARAFGAVDRGLVALERNAGVKIVADWVVLQL
jgi:DNA polymerase-3 subunit delta'